PSTDNLMRSPKLTPQQTQLNHALTLAAGTSSDGIKLKYPKEGQYRSAFVFYDLNNDGNDEAIAFYQADNKGNRTWVSVLDQKDNNWISIYDFAGRATDVDFVSFAHLTNSKSCNMIVGWSDMRSASKTISVFEYNDMIPTEIFTGNYRQYAIYDFDDDHLDEIILIDANDAQNKSYADLVAWNGHTLDIVSSGIQLNRNIQKFAQVKPGKLTSGKSALFIDEYIDDNLLVTEIITAQNNELINELKPDDKTDYTRLTERSSGVLCQDVYNDGIIEIPTAIPLPENDFVNNDEDTYYLTQFNDLVKGKLSVICSAFVNTKQGYMITVPANWVDKVTLISEPQSNEWQFIEATPDKAGANEVLLRIRVYSQNDYHDKFENFNLLTKKGLFEYYSYIPKNNSKLAISQT
ncbi:MAG: hypothetical protein RR263_01925, partial [Oscillospiraceae bacterium]